MKHYLLFVLTLLSSPLWAISSVNNTFTYRDNVFDYGCYDNLYENVRMDVKQDFLPSGSVTEVTPIQYSPAGPKCHTLMRGSFEAPSDSKYAYQIFDSSLTCSNTSPDVVGEIEFGQSNSLPKIRLKENGTGWFNYGPANSNPWTFTISFYEYPFLGSPPKQSTNRCVMTMRSRNDSTMYQIEASISYDRNPRAPLSAITVSPSIVNIAASNNRWEANTALEGATTANGTLTINTNHPVSIDLGAGWSNEDTSFITNLAYNKTAVFNGNLRMRGTVNNPGLTSIIANLTLEVK